MSAGQKQRLAGLQDLAQLVLDSQLAELRQIVRAREESLARLAALNRPFADTDLPPMIAAEAEIRFQRWADLRRAEINQTLARQNVRLEEARAAAQSAFGRADVLARLRDGVRS